MDKKEVIQETKKHIDRVSNLLMWVKDCIINRAIGHDKSKLSPEELPIFVKYTPKLKGCTYGSGEYKQFLAEMKPALDHHYAKNRHHPEHFRLQVADDFEFFEKNKKNTICCMNMIDLIEMLCDWLAATERHADGDIYKSIEINQKRFGYSDELKSILINTVQAIKPPGLEKRVS